VNWNDAMRFCEWLTSEERRRGTISPIQLYRLPTDHEWQIAAGENTYPWGDAWPPPPGAANFFGVEASETNAGELSRMPGYNDEFEWTARVDALARNALGISGLAGNVYEWCSDSLPNMGRVLKGGSWFSNERDVAQTDFKFNGEQSSRGVQRGFRLVLELANGTANNAPATQTTRRRQSDGATAN